MKTYPKVRGTVDGRSILNPRNIPNIGSLDSTLDDYEILPDLREVPMTDFPGVRGKHYSVQGSQRIEELAEQIQQSKKISPLIVVIDREGPYILEGSTRIEALYRIDTKTFPALVVIDLDDPPSGYQKQATQTQKGHSMSDLRKKLIKLAHNNPPLRKDILPLLEKGASAYQDSIPLWTKADAAIGQYFRILRDQGASRKVLQQVQSAQFELAKAFKAVQTDTLRLAKKADFKTSWDDTKSQADDFARQMKQFAKYFPRMAQMKDIEEKTKKAIEEANPKVQEVAKLMAEVYKLIKKIK